MKVIRSFINSIWVKEKGTLRSLLLHYGVILYLLLGITAPWCIIYLNRVGLVEHDAEMSRQFVQSVFEVTDSEAYLRGEQAEGGRELEHFLHRLLEMPGVLQAVIYNLDGMVLWSNIEDMLGMRFTDNDQLNEALQGSVTTNEDDQHDKSEAAGSKHERFFLSKSVGHFVEIYVPLYGQSEGRVVGVVELYRDSRHLYERINRGQTYIVVFFVSLGLLLVVMLSRLVNRANLVVQEQRKKLVRDAGLVAIGAAGSAVAHNIRNPLANIRSSAELLMLDAVAETRDTLNNIVCDVDRINQWIESMLEYVRSNRSQHMMQLGSVLKSAIQSVEGEARRKNIVIRSQPNVQWPPVIGETHIAEHILISILSNAVEAAPVSGGLVQVTIVVNGGWVSVDVTDNGSGIPDEVLRNLDHFSVRSRPSGMGIGLTLTKRLLEAFEGALEFPPSTSGTTTVSAKFKRLQDGDIPPDRGA